MPISRAHVLLAALTVVLALASPGSRAAEAAAPLRKLATLQVLGRPLAVFDISFVSADGVYALSDRSNGGVEFFNSASGAFRGRATGFAGYDRTKGFDAAGPNGLVAVGRGQFWAGDGDSTVKVIDLRSRRVIVRIATGGRRRTDEMTYDPRDHLVVAVNNADDPPFVRFISIRTRRVLGRLVLAQAADGAEQPVWDRASGLIYLSIPSLDHDQARGAAAVIDPRRRALVRLLPLARCMPARLALGPHQHLLVGCSDDGVAAGFPARSFVMSTSGRIVARLPRVGGSDEVWADPRARRNYLAAVANTGGPVLGVVESLTDRWLGNVPTGPHAHSVAADAPTRRCSFRSLAVPAARARTAASRCSLRAGRLRSRRAVMRHAALRPYQQVAVESPPDESCAACRPTEFTLNEAQLVSLVCVPIAVAVNRKDGGFAALSTLVTAIS